MSTKREDYVILGLNIGYNKCDEDKWHEYQRYLYKNNPGEFVYLIDGMNSEYFIVGEVLAYGNEFDGFENIYEFDFDFDARKIHESTLSVKQLLKTNFGIEAQPKILVLTHWR